ncbi:hypothetical protein PFNF135_00165 [Plasmodium falciparum NF135/5.C10]|uniref:Uncharacterized protein n=1 Tax=Plasmodium falciparum NF135/5.C10 TaxID=1036726 RepID=W4INF6_PLAFA|nr:hypothetical protein PFNF135_00165 [Plasmodium falciparum NF135/5.C10]
MILIHRNLNYSISLSGMFGKSLYCILIILEYILGYLFDKNRDIYCYSYVVYTHNNYCSKHWYIIYNTKNYTQKYGCSKKTYFNNGKIIVHYIIELYDFNHKIL